MKFKIWTIFTLLLLIAACGGDEFYDEEFYGQDEPFYDDEEFYEDEPFVDEETAAFDDTPADEISDDSPAPQPIAAGDASYREADCPFDPPRGYDLECGYLAVPENRTRADSRLIELAVVLVYFAGPDADGVLYLAGGPGGSAISDFIDAPDSWEYPFTQNRTLILLDQRGTGYSLPTLDCPELAEENGGLFAANPEVECNERLLDEGIDLTGYNTVENAADVAALRVALGYDEWDLLGISYGTRLALSVMRDHPEGLRSVVLDSVFPPNADTPLDEALSGYEALQTLFADCASDAACNSAYPDLENVFLDAVAAYNEDPLDGDFFGDDLLFAVTQALNATSEIPWVPQAIYAASEGDLIPLEETGVLGFGVRNTAVFQDDVDRSDSEGMYNSVICHDELGFGRSYEQVEDEIVGQVPEELEAGLLQPVADLFNVCSYWGAGEAAARENTAVSSNIPTLILAGQYDVATPPRWATLTAQTLPNSYVFEYPGSGHSLLSDVECAINMTAVFLDNPTSRPDDSCIAQMVWPDFVVD